MTTKVQIFGVTSDQDNLWTDIKRSDGVAAQVNIDFSDLSGELELSAIEPRANDYNFASVGGFIKGDLEGALANAGYIKQSQRTPSKPEQESKDCKNLWNGLSIAMTCVSALLVIILIMLLKRVLVKK